MVIADSPSPRTSGKTQENDHGREVDLRSEGSSPVAVTLLGVYLLALGLLLASLIVSLWPVIEQVTLSTESTIQGQGGSGTGQGPGPELMNWLGRSYELTPEMSLLLLVVVFGAIGSFIHSTTSFVDYVGNRKFVSSWTWWYVLRPFAGAALALVFYVAIRGGFVAQEAQTGDVNPYGIAALAGLAGLFSKQATDKLREVFDTFFRTAEGSGDQARGDSLTNPVPKVTSIDPKTHPASGADIVVKVKGADFVSDSVVLVEGIVMNTVYKSPSELTIRLPASLTEKKRELEIRVRNPEPGGGVSESTTFILD